MLQTQHDRAALGIDDKDFLGRRAPTCLAFYTLNQVAQIHHGGVQIPPEGDRRLLALRPRRGDLIFCGRDAQGIAGIGLVKLTGGQLGQGQIEMQGDLIRGLGQGRLRIDNRPGIIPHDIGVPPGIPQHIDILPSGVHRTLVVRCGLVVVAQQVVGVGPLIQGIGEVGRNLNCFDQKLVAPEHTPADGPGQPPRHRRRWRTLGKAVTGVKTTPIIQKVVAIAITLLRTTKSQRTRPTTVRARE